MWSGNLTFSLAKMDPKPLFDVYLNMFLLAIGWLLISLSALDVLKPNFEAQEIWFQRSGSLLVVLSIFIEVYGGRLTAHTVKYSTRISLVLGTLVWGYGDLIYLYLEQSLFFQKAGFIPMILLLHGTGFVLILLTTRDSSINDKQDTKN